MAAPSLLPLLLALTSLLLPAISASSSSSYFPCSFPAIFNFGDSNSDTGGLSAAFSTVSEPNGETFFGTPSGRPCDGRLVIDFIGAAYKDLLPPEEYFAKALYTFDIGQNDLTSGYVSNMTTEQVKGTIPIILDKFTDAIESVYGLGGRYFWIHNTGPVGCLPYILARYPLREPEVDPIGCGAPFNEVAQLFNAKLKETIVQLRKTFPCAVFTYVDVYTVKYWLISHAERLGFEQPFVACCGHGGKYNFDARYGCGATETINNTKIIISNTCTDPSKRICWDGYHYTEAANKWVFDRIVNGAFSDPPIPVAMTCRR
ncbi:hypothetical protein ZIOFF_026643 [Zingiber officinale]|uniref:GDSL esterase/lipase n=1 Tax=Zingiber officinale TaxID=94328 RepID=A0A8J5H546_ZINOF|nr:hypothetical protein ZIOFF_026643 [Zingiber officinale]